MLRTIVFVIFFTLVSGFNILVGKTEETFDIIKPGYPKETIKVIESWLSHKSFISFVTGEKDRVYFLKQVQNPDPKAQFYVIREALASEIAKGIDLPAHETRIIPAYMSLPGKKDAKRPATIHTVVPGDVVSKAPAPYNVYIQQPMKPQVHPSEWGLTRRVVKEMSVHPDLPRIVAHDTFSANGDRHKKNFFYDPKSNRYYAIDLESAFNKNLAELACKCIESFLSHPHRHLSYEEQRGLIRYRKTLKNLVHQFPCLTQYRLLNKFIKEAALHLCFSYSYDLRRGIRKYRYQIAQNYKSTVRLIGLLDKLIDQFPRTIHKESTKPNIQVLPYSITLKEVYNCIKSYKRAYGVRGKKSNNKGNSNDKNHK